MFILDVDGTQLETDDEISMYFSDTLTGLVTDKFGDTRGELLIKRDAANGDAEVWMKSSGGAKVIVETNGDVTITLGT